MNIQMIDLEEFFNEKYTKIDNNLGIAATGIITEKQMVTRVNKSYKNIKGVGSHFKTEGWILSDIFGFDEKLFLGYGYDSGEYSKLDKNHKKVLGEVIEIKYINNETGNLILIYLPLQQKTITEKQLSVIEYLNDYIEEISRKINRPIKIMITDRKNSATEINSLRNSIIPFAKKRIDDTYIQSILEENIIAENELKQKVLK